MTTLLTNDDLFEMVNLRGRSTGLNNNIWIGPRGGGARHAARIRVQRDHREKFDRGDLAVVSVEDDPPQLVEGELSAEDLELVRATSRSIGERSSIIGARRRTALS